MTVRRGRARRGTTCARPGLARRVRLRRAHPSARRARAARGRSSSSRSRRTSCARGCRRPGGARTYRRRSGRPRVLLAVLAGRVERPTLTVDVTRRRPARPASSRDRRRPSRSPTRSTVPAWRSRIAAASGGGDACVAWERVPPRYAATPEPARGPAAMRRRRRRRAGRRGRSACPGAWSSSASAGARVRSAVLRTPARRQPLPLESKTRAFLAVLRRRDRPGGVARRRPAAATGARSSASSTSSR